jgi:hypothetical protein
MVYMNMSSILWSMLILHLTLQNKTEPSHNVHWLLILLKNPGFQLEFLTGLEDDGCLPQPHSINMGHFKTNC